MPRRARTMKRGRRRWLFLAAALLSASAVASCDTRGDPDTRAYWTGCGAGHAETGGTLATYAARDDERYATEPHYREAWEQGFKNCYHRKNLRK